MSSSRDKQCGIFFSSLQRISDLSAGLGIPISISFSNLPGRRRAGSSESGRLVAAKTKTAEVDDYTKQGTLIINIILNHIQYIR